ncbi:MAG: hypothetical protein KDC71_22085, partial [Acidobacteria bacterium]|nr:hypothetical protein [Acidobacteriota bacterium]
MENTLPKNRTRVLILWDQDFPSLVLANHLEKKGFDIRPVTRMSDIKSFLQPGQVVLVDEKFIESFFQKNQSLDRQPVIVLIGPQKPDLVRKALQQGASDFISKPVDLDLAEARIRIQIQLLETTQALEISRQRYELALEGTSDGIWD